jgi:hypothetical protein
MSHSIEGGEMRRFVVILVVCGLVLMAFAAAASAKSKAVPFKGYLSGEVVFTPDFTGQSPTGLWTDSSAAGNVSHLGKTLMTSRHPTPEFEDIDNGKMTLVAANGDEVSITYIGFAPYPEPGVPGTIVVDIDFTVVDGTGRFADASGGGKMTGYVQFPGVFSFGPWPAVWTWQASIRY